MPGTEPTLPRWAAYQQLAAALTDGVLCARADGLWGSSRALVLAALARETGRPILATAASAADRHRAGRDAAFFLAALPATGERSARPGPGDVLEFPSEQP